MGVIVIGKVTDETGTPIARALVRTRVGNDTRTAFTGKGGAYRLEGCDPGKSRIVATAKHRAPNSREVEIGPGLGAVDFRLEPGGTIRVRVLDEKGQPVPRAALSLRQMSQDLDLFEFDQAPRETDGDGVWQWDEAPDAGLMASISRPNGMTLFNRPLVARNEEYVFRVPRPLTISGKVVDAETKQPIQKFRADEGYLWNGQLSLIEAKPVASSEGRYEIHQIYQQSGHVVRVLADGYLPAVSRKIESDEGNVTVDFELIRGKSVAARVLTPDGVPAAGARVVLATPNDQFVVREGILEQSAGNASVRQTDEAGQVRLESNKENWWIVVTHRSGFVELAGLPSSYPPIIKLRPWARVEGTYQVAHRPGPGAEISLFTGSFMHDSPQIRLQLQQTTDARGRFAFDWVVPGPQSIGRSRMNNAGDSEMTSRATYSIDCLAGKTTHVDLGVGGRPVIGQLRRPPDAKPSLQLSSVLIYLSQNSGGFRLDYPQVEFSARPDPDGNFAIDDVPPGIYYLSAYFTNPGGGPHIQNHRFTVPKVNEKLSQRPVDLGVVMFKPEESR
jgi:hypothetical protein